MTKIAFIAAAGLAIAACTRQETPNDRDSDALKAADAALTQAVTKGDLEKVASFYADDAVLMPTAEPLISGKAAIRDEWRHIFGIPGIQSESALKHIDVSRSGDMGYTRGIYTSRMAGPKGEPLTEPGKWLSIWRRQTDGQWRIVAEIYNTDIMPPVHAPSTAEPH